MMKVLIKYKHKYKKITDIDKKKISNIKVNFHPFIFKNFGLHYDSYELIDNNNIQIKDDTIIDLTYLNIDELCLDIKIIPEINCFKNILTLNADNLDNSCFLCGLPKKDSNICFHSI